MLPERPAVAQFMYIKLPLAQVMKDLHVSLERALLCWIRIGEYGAHHDRIMAKLLRNVNQRPIYLPN